MSSGDVDDPRAPPPRDGDGPDAADEGTGAREAGGSEAKGSPRESGAVPDDPWRKLSYETEDGDDEAGDPDPTETGPGDAPEPGDPEASSGADGDAGPEEEADGAEDGDGELDDDAYGPEDRGSGLIGEHAHETPHPEDWPYLERGDEKGLDKHPYCEDCGLVKHVGPDRPLPGGGLVNLVARVRDRLEREGRTVTDAQKRLVMQRLRDGNVDDDWGLDRATQLAQFEEVVSEVTGVEPSFVHGIMHDILERRGRRV